MSEENVVTIRGIHVYILHNMSEENGDDPWYPYILHNMSEENVVTIRGIHVYILHNMSEENVVTIGGIHTSYIICQKKTW